MRRGGRIALIAGGSLLGLLLVLLAGGIGIVRTDWFRNLVRAKIVSSVETATGGRTEVGSFAFDWRHLRASVRNFVVHGLEPPDVPPLFRANLVQVDLKLLSPWKGAVDIASLIVEAPQANVIVYLDGHTNIPAPKVAPTSKKTGLETIVDLAIGHFELRNGSFILAQRKSDFNARGENLRAQMAYNILHPGYSGEIDVSPLHMTTGGQAPLEVAVQLPITLNADRIALDNARLSTPESQIVVSGSMDHLAAPRTSAHVRARIALDEVQRAGISIPLDLAQGPKEVTADVTGSMDGNRVVIQRARVDLGQSELSASGSAGGVQFSTSLSLGEIGRLLRVAARPEGTLRIAGNASMNSLHDFRIAANVDGHPIAVGQGAARVAGVRLDASISADPRHIELGGLRLAAMGGTLQGSGEVEDLERYHFSGKLSHFEIEQILHTFAPDVAGYSGRISGGVEAAGGIGNGSNMAARVRLAIAPVSRGVPLSGRLNVDYNGGADTVAVDRSYLALPHTRVDLSGSLGRQIQVRVVTRDLSDLRPAVSIPVTFNGGVATVNATVSGKLSAPVIDGQVEASRFSIGERPFTHFGAALNASPAGASVRDATLSRGTLEARFSAAVGLRNWKPEPNQPLKVDATIRNADMADVLAVAGQSDVPASGALAVDAHLNGTVANPRGNAELTVSDGALEGEHFDSLSARVVMTDQAIDIPTLQWIAGPSRIDASATYRHAANDLGRGVLRGHVASNQIQLAQFQSLVKGRPGLRGVLSANADAAATVEPSAAGTQVQLTSVNGNIAARGLQLEGKAYGDFTAAATTSGSAVRFDVTSDFSGSTIRASGQTGLTGEHETNATAEISNLPIGRVLAFAGRPEPVAGTLTATARVSGTLHEPHASVNLNVSNGSAYQEPFQRLQVTVNYSSQSIDVPQFRVEQGGSSVEWSASFSHPPNDLENGQVRFHLRGNALQLSRLHTVQQQKPGLSGAIELAADGAATLRANAAPLFSALNANLSAKELALDRKPLGDLTATAETRGGGVDFSLNSGFAQANIRGSGRLDLADGYPIKARLDFSNVTWSGLSNWIGGPPGATFDAAVDGGVTVSGAAARTDDLSAKLQLSRLEAHSLSPGNRVKPRVQFELHNDGPVVASLDRGVATIQSARITGPYTTLALSGTASMRSPQSLNLRANGNIKLEVLEAFDADIVSSGSIALNAAVAGTAANPTVNGRLELQKASFNTLDLPNGLSDASGAVTFTGTEANVQNITGQSGGGKVTLAGFVSYGGPEMQFHLDATADRVHVEAAQDIAAAASARLTLAGVTSRSLLSGTVRVHEVAMRSHSDVGSIFSSAAAPPAGASSSTGLLAGMRFDVRVITASDIQFRTALTQNLQADANLTLRGSPDHPGMLGRISVTQGEVVFFGNQYTIGQGTISFFDPNKIDPILDVGLQTKVQGVDVTLSVSGSADRMKLSYSSDPPLQLSEIISLLGSGKAPTSDPVLAARQPEPPTQSFQQEGASMLLGQAVANPVAGRLQRLFGVSQLKIEPQVSGASGTPQATLTLKQQITREVTFTYIQDVTQGNSQIIRMEWAINPRWSAVAARDLTGEFNVDLFYKKRFR